MAEFKISRLRFTWSGQWEAGTFYNRDAVVQYNGKMYVCLVPNTSSADFYDDLYYQTPGGADEPYWNLVIDGTSWVGDWQPTTLYSLGNLVRFGGAVYICTEAHTSNSTAIDPTKFDTYAQYANWNSAWTTSYAYGIGDVVKYGGIVYVCTANHTSANTVNLGLEIDILNWEVLNSGIEYKGIWSSGTKYKLNDIVKLGPSLYKANVGHVPSASFDDTKWDDWLPGEQFGSTWSSSTTYQPGEIVLYGGYSYISNINNNLNNIPSTEVTEWSLLNQGYNLRSDWTGGFNSEYKVGDIVRRGGITYEAIADNNNQDPNLGAITTTYVALGSSGTTVNVASSVGITAGMIVIGAGFNLGQTVISVSTGTVVLNTAPNGAVTNGQSLKFVGVNSTYWKILIPGVDWDDNWAAGTVYLVGNLSRYKNGTYVCIQQHSSNSANRPDNDTSNTYWTLYAAHARKNALTTYGDLEAYIDGEYAAIPIGTETFTLRSTDTVPTWSHINTIAKLYYVAPTGTDTTVEGYGLTWDKPWKTIRYACSIAEAGDQYANAANILRSNKDFLTTEMYQWMLYQVAEENAPFTLLSEFDEEKTIRDASYIIDAIANDITRGGNSQTVAATLAYFENGSTTNFFNAAVAEQMPYFVAALNRLLIITNYVINQQNVDVNYQNLNTVDIPDIILATYGLPSAEAGAQTLVDSLINIVITALTDQNTADVPPPNSGISTSIMVKTGTYNEILPIVIPENVAVCGDELRSVVVQPITRVVTTGSATTGVVVTDPGSPNEVSTPVHLITVESTEGLEDEMPVQFVTDTINNIAISVGGISSGVNYYVIGSSITATQFSISETPGGDVFELTTDTGSMSVYAGDCLKDMFYMRNASGLRNMTVNGLLGTLSDPDLFTIKQPTGGAYVSLDPGNGPTDTNSWIIRRSPYVQNVTAFGTGCTALKIDGTLHNGGNKSIVCNDFTHIISDGIGVWCTGPSALCEAVSIFSYYGYAGYFAQNGGRIRATNGNSSYGTYGVVAQGYDATEVPTTGTVFNQSSQTQAQVQSAFGAVAQLLAINYSNAGSEYDVSTTNLLNYSNDFLDASWTHTGLNFSKVTEAPTGLIEAWTFTGDNATAGGSYIYQDIAVTPKGATYSNLQAVNITGNGGQIDPATFDVTVTSTGYVVTVNNPGEGYVNGNQLNISGGQLGGRDGVNDCGLTITSLAGSGILEVEPAGTVPAGSNLNYT